MDKRISQPIEKQELTTKASVWQWGKDRAPLPFCKRSQKSPRKKPKGASDWPWCFHWGLHSQATSQRKISYSVWSPAPFRFQVQSKIQSTGKRVHKEWHSWLVQTWLIKEQLMELYTEANNHSSPSWVVWTCGRIPCSAHLFGGVLFLWSYTGSGWPQWGQNLASELTFPLQALHCVKSILSNSLSLILSKSSTLTKNAFSTSVTSDSVIVPSSL